MQCDLVDAARELLKRVEHIYNRVHNRRPPASFRDLWSKRWAHRGRKFSYNGVTESGRDRTRWFSDFEDRRGTHHACELRNDGSDLVNTRVPTISGDGKGRMGHGEGSKKMGVTISIIKASSNTWSY